MWNNKIDESSDRSAKKPQFLTMIHSMINLTRFIFLMTKKCFYFFFQ